MFLAFIAPIGTLLAAPALLPLEQFANKASVTDMKISPTGAYTAFTYEYGDEVRAAIMDSKTKEIISKFDNGPKNHVQRMVWLNETRLGMWWAKVAAHFDGKPQFPVFSVSDADGKNRRQLWTYENRYSLSLTSVLKDSPKYILVQTRSYQDNGRVKLRKLNIYNGKTSYIRDIPESSRNPSLRRDRL